MLSVSDIFNLIPEEFRWTSGFWFTLLFGLVLGVGAGIALDKYVINFKQEYTITTLRTELKTAEEKITNMEKEIESLSVKLEIKSNKELLTKGDPDYIYGK